MNLTKGEITRFRSKYVEGHPDHCWMWRGAKYANGYGMVSLRRGKRKTFSAHRVAWSAANSKNIPNGMMICHKCDNRLCVNPSHLYLGSGIDNNRDTVVRNRGNRVLGSKCSWAKLSEDDVRFIRESVAAQRDLAERFQIDPSTVSQIKSRKRWKHLA